MLAKAGRHDPFWDDGKGARRRNRRVRVESALALTLAVSALPAQAAGTALRCGRLLDPASGRVIQNAVVLVNGDRIERIGPGVEVPADGRVIDLSRLTCLPGLIDSHTHVLLQPEDERLVEEIAEAVAVVSGSEQGYPLDAEIVISSEDEEGQNA